MKLLLLVLFFTVAVANANAQPGKGTEAPEISLPNTKDAVVNLSSLRGKVVLIDFWASWCGPCRRAIPQLQSLYKKYKDKGFEVYAVSLDYDKNSWKKAIFEDNTKWLHVIDPQGNVAEKWNVKMIPNSYLLDKQGRIISIDAEGDELDELLHKLLG